MRLVVSAIFFFALWVSTSAEALTVPVETNSPIMVSLVSRKTAEKIFRHLQTLPHTYTDPDLNGCGAATHLAAYQLEQEGLQVAKAYAEGVLHTPVLAAYHVGLALAVGSRRNYRIFILDPLYFVEILEEDRWRYDIQASADGPVTFRYGNRFSFVHTDPLAWTSWRGLEQSQAFIDSLARSPRRYR